MPQSYQTTLIARGSYTSVQLSPNQENDLARGVMISLHVIANPGGAETLTIQLIELGVQNNADQVIGSLASVAATNGTWRLMWYPGASTAPDGTHHKTYALRLSRRWRVNIAHSSTGVWTYRVDADILH